MGILKNIEWKDDSRDTIVYRYDMKNDYVSRGSVLTVRDSQAAIFAHKGKMADVFLPGYYKLDTDSIPVLTHLMSWKYGFENPFRSDIYFVNTRQFAGQKWGTANPIIIRDRDYGAIRVRGYGTYSFRVSDPFVFMTELSGTGSGFATRDITDYLKSLVVTGISDAIGESRIPILDLAGNLIEMGEIVKKSLSSTFSKMGLELTQFVFENFSLPKELEEALDKNATLGMYRNNMDVYTEMAKADALRKAAENPGAAGTVVGAGIGLGAGAALGGMMREAAAPRSSAPSGASTVCPACNKQVPLSAKFCPYCGAAMVTVCPTCGMPVPASAKFCAECGGPVVIACPGCGKSLPVGTKFCPDCGKRLM